MEHQNNFPSLRFPEFTREWEKKKLGDVFSIFNGYAFPSNESVEHGVLWVKIADVGIQEMKKDNLSFLPLEFTKKHSKFLLNKGDYVVALTRPILKGKLKIAQIDDYFDCSLLNQRVGKIESQNSKGFIYCYLQKDDLIKSIENNIAGSDPPNLSTSEINSIELVIPSLPEQEKIASFLSGVDDKLQALKKKKSLLDQYKKGLMQKIFSQEFRFKDDDGNEFPEWKEKKLGEVVKIVSGYSPSMYKLNANDDYPFIKVEDLNNCDKYQFNSRNYTNSKKGLIKVNSIIFAKRGAAILINKIRINKVPLIMDSNLMGLECNSKIYFEFLYYFIDFEKLYKIADTSSIPQINNKHIEPYLIYLPHLEEQTKIANFLSAIDEKIHLVQSQIENMEVWKKGLLQKMFV